MVVHGRLPVEFECVRANRSVGRASRGAAVGMRKRRQVYQIYVLLHSREKAFQGGAVVARERMPVGRVDMLLRKEGRAPQGATVGDRERLPSSIRKWKSFLRKQRKREPLRCVFVLGLRVIAFLKNK